MEATAGSSVRLRVAGAESIDPAAIAEVVNAAFYLHAFMTADRTSPEGVLEEMGTDGVFILAEDDEGLAGTALLKPSIHGDSDDIEDAVNVDHAAYLGLVCVPPRVNRTGIGRRLMSEAERLATEMGYSQVTLGTVREMGNVDYYEVLGYRVVGSQPFPAGKWGLAIDFEHCTMVKDLLLIREAKPGEAETITGIINRAYEVESFFKIGDRTDVDEIRRFMTHDTFLVAESGGQLIGTVRVSQHGREGHFGMLSVEQSLKGRGLGRKLVAAAEAWAIERGCDEMTLEVVNLRTELFPWYEKLGYSLCGTQPWPEDSKERISQPAHFVLMRRDLPVTAGPEER